MKGKGKPSFRDVTDEILEEYKEIWQALADYDKRGGEYECPGHTYEPHGEGIRCVFCGYEPSMVEIAASMNALVLIQEVAIEWPRMGRTACA